MRPQELDVGARIRAFRKKNKLSLNKLSKLTGIAASNLSSMELNKSSPTLATLLRIAAAFDMPVGALLDQVLHTSASVCRSGQGRPVEVSEAGVATFDLTGNLYRAMLAAELVRLDRGSAPFDLGTGGGDRFVYGLEGGITVSVDNDLIELAAGDSLFVEAEARLVVENRRHAAARLLVVRATSPSQRPSRR